jgi:hypothetical protein
MQRISRIFIASERVDGFFRSDGTLLEHLEELVGFLEQVPVIPIELAMIHIEL